MALWIQISPGSGVAIYLQIVAQVAGAIGNGELLTGEKLPSVRRLAGELVVNPNTVAKAYYVLEQNGLLRTKVGSGSYVAEPRLRKPDMGKVNILGGKIDHIIAEAFSIGVKGDELREMFLGRIDKFSRKREGGKREI